MQSWPSGDSLVDRGAKMKNYKPVFIILAITIILFLALITTPTTATVSSSPLPAYCAGLIAVPAQKYLFESRYIYGKIVDEHRLGYCWQIGDGGTPKETFDKFCWVIHLDDPTAHCSPGPASLEALKLVYLTWLPVVGR